MEGCTARRESAYWPTLPVPPPSPTSESAAGHFVLVEDDVLLRDLLARTLTQRFAPTSLRTHGNGEIALADCLANPPDLLLADLRLPGLDGRELIRRLRARHPGTRCMVLTSSTSPALPAELLGLGVSGFIDKASPIDHLERAVERVLAGGMFFSTHVSPGPAEEPRPAPMGPALDVLTEREREVARLVAGGLISKEIADRLGLSPRTVEKERAVIMEKIGVRDLTGFIRWCVRHGLA
jgi:DNA-binding NarL/FixJ family response regulator